VLSVLSAPRFLRLSLLLLFLTLPGRASAAPAPVQPDASWTALANSRPQDVLRWLKPGNGSREERLAWAAARIGAQPVADDNLRAAEAVLVELERGQDDIAAQAAYLRARIHQLHLTQPDFAQAAGLYQALFERQPRSHWAQLGLVKLGLLKLYVLPETTAPGADRLAAAEALLGRIQEPLLQRDLHLQIGQAGVVLKQPLERFLPHLVAADRIGGIGGTAREDLIVQVGVLSLRAGRWAQAKEYFERYLAEYPTNVRAFTIRKKLEEANGHLAKGGGA
jgi:hypothetical protein